MKVSDKVLIKVSYIICCITHILSRMLILMVDIICRTVDHCNSIKSIMCSC